MTRSEAIGHITQWWAQAAFSYPEDERSRLAHEFLLVMRTMCEPDEVAGVARVMAEVCTELAVPA